MTLLMAVVETIDSEAVEAMTSISLEEGTAVTKSKRVTETILCV